MTCRKSDNKGDETMTKRLTQEEVEKYYLDNGYELLSEYKNIKHKNRIKNVKTGKVYKQSFDNFRQGRRSENRVNYIVSYEKFKKLVNSTDNYSLVSPPKEYKNKKSSLYVKELDTGRVFLCNYTSFRNGHRGNILTQEKKKEYLDYRKTYIENRGYTLLTEHYVPSSKKIKLRNNTNGNVFNITWDQFKQGYRDGNHYYSYAEVSNIVSKDGYQLEYFHNVGNLHLITPSGYKWSVSLDRFLRGTRCPKEGNAKSIGENILMNLFKKESIPFYTQYKVTIDGDVHLFDFLLPELNIVVEYDGVQHYEPIGLFGGERALAKRRKRDKLKESYCYNNGLKLIRVPYTCDTARKIINNINHSCLLNKIIYDDSYNYNYVLNYKSLFDGIVKNGLSYMSEQTKLTKDTLSIKFKQYAGITYLEYKRKQYAEYYLTHTYTQCMSNFGKGDFHKAFLSYYGMKKSDYTELNSKYKKKIVPWNKIEDRTKMAIASYYLVNSSQDTVTKYKHDRHTINNIFKQVYGMTKTEYLKQYPELKN